MRIKLQTKAMITGYGQNPLPRGAVIEATNDAEKAEYAALVNVNYAKETKEEITHTIDGAKPKAAGVSGIDGNDEAHAKALEGTVPEVTEYIATLDKVNAKRLAKLEAKGQARKGVADAVDAHVASLGEG